jgi:translation initiation factor 2 subunit 1
VAERTGLSRDEVYQKVGAVLEENYGLYDGFEKTLKEGTSALTKLGVPEDLAKVVFQVAEERIKVKTVKVWGTLEVRCSRPNGVKCIQEAFLNAKKAHKSKDSQIQFSIIAAPKYRVEVSADNWKRAEEILSGISEGVVANIHEVGGRGEFKREK